MITLTRKISRPLFSRLASSYKWDDPFNLEELYTEEEKGCRDTMAKYAQTQLMPRVTKMWRDESKDLDIFKEFGELGLFGPNIKGYGCAGVSNVAVGLMSREVERVCSGFRSMWSVTNHLVMYPIYTFGSDELKDRFLPDLAKGKKIGCFGLTEPHAGSDPASMLTKCEKTGNDWILNGEKMWISNSPFADVFVVWAKDKSDGVIRGFVLEKGMPGLSAPPIKGKLSLRSSTTGGIVMENVKVPDANRLFKVQGLKGPFSCLNQARYGIAWGALGAGEYCYHAARDYTLNRKQFNRPLASNQLIQVKLADMSTELSMGLVACYRAGRLKDEGTLNPETVSMIKRTCTMSALKAARTSRDIFGANGIIEDNHIMRHMTNLETVITYEGTYDIHGLILGRAITGISAFS